MNKCRICGEELSPFDYKCSACGEIVNKNLSADFEEYKSKYLEEYNNSVNDFNNDDTNIVENEVKKEVNHSTNNVTNTGYNSTTIEPSKEEVAPPTSLNNEKNKDVGRENIERAFQEKINSRLNENDKALSEEEILKKEALYQIKPDGYEKEKRNNIIRFISDAIIHIIFVSFFIWCFVLFNRNTATTNEYNYVDYDKVLTQSENRKIMTVKDFFPEGKYTLSETDTTSSKYTNFKIKVEFKGKELNTDICIEDLLALGFEIAPEYKNVLNHLGADSEYMFTDQIIDLNYKSKLDGSILFTIELYIDTKENKVVSILDKDDYVVSSLELSCFGGLSDKYTEEFNYISINGIPYTEIKSDLVFTDKMRASSIWDSDSFSKVTITNSLSQEAKDEFIKNGPMAFYTTLSTDFDKIEATLIFYSDIYSHGKNNCRLSSIKLENEFVKNTLLDFTPIEPKLINLNLNSTLTVSDLEEIGYKFKNEKNIESFIAGEAEYLVNSNGSQIYIKSDYNSVDLNKVDENGNKTTYRDFPIEELSIASSHFNGGLSFNDAHFEFATPYEIANYLGLPVSIRSDYSVGSVINKAYMVTILKEDYRVYSMTYLIKSVDNNQEFYCLEMSFNSDNLLREISIYKTNYYDSNLRFLY